MKFAKYLHNTEISEWRKAYIDYRGLKKLINAIELSQKDHDPRESDIGISAQLFSSIASSEVDLHADERSKSLESSSILLVQPLSEHRISVSAPSIDPRGTLQACLFDTSSRSGLCRGLYSTQRDSESDTNFMDPSANLPLHKIITQLTPQELAFFSAIDAQLDKVESFYLGREKEMVARSLMLLNQLEDLKDHRGVFEAHSTGKKGWASSTSLRSRIRSPSFRTSSKIPEDWELEGQVFKTAVLGDRRSTVDSLSNDNHSFILSADLFTEQSHRELEDSSNCNSSTRNKRKSERPHLFMSTDSDDPASFIRANRKLKKAVIEHYRGLESLHNYCVLNVTGFRKAIKKFEKITKIPVQKQYMAEKVENCAFASNDIVRNLTRAMEENYASLFARGDGKKACKRLRAKAVFKSHHFNVFRSGLLFGFAMFALVDGLLKALQPETQQAIPCWDILLFLYGLIFVPVLNSFLLGMNLVVWARFRINYIFIFDLNVSSCLDYRQYFEIPSLLLASLCFAFWASFSRLGNPTLHFTTWPLLWLSFAILILVHPLPVMAKTSRYWIIKTILKLFLFGVRPVKFVDFWLGDQLCSFVFTISNAPLFVCVYLDNFSDDWQKCNNSSRMWPIAAFGSIPFVIRLGQCVKRYFDSKRVTHLVNAAKYGTGIVSYLFYFLWSYQEESRGAIFALWCFFNTCYSFYACSWDFLVDFSFFQSHSKHLFLRTELMYTHQWVYYFAMSSNLLIRFMWVIYIPQAGPPMMVRTFITAMFEMLRRVQWNFYRLEAEHIGNTDRYRVNREIPLPYAFDFDMQEEDRDALTGKR